MRKVEKHIILKLEERKELLAVTRKGKAKEVLHANILLMSDEGATGFKTPTEIAKLLCTTKQTVNNIKTRYFKDGIANSVQRKPLKEPSRKPKITGEKEARIIALACSKAPQGYSSWSLRLLTSQIIELKIMDSVGRMTVDRLLKKHNLSLG
ncbi:MAG: helix-turn-helix domain-containing protein [Clostridiales bacterium]|jgi:transposase|nr:helix-turn-helix domain-containing protein [Clostridiales bacterium]